MRSTRAFHFVTGRNIFDTQAVDPGFSGVDYPRLGRSVFLQILQEL